MNKFISLLLAISSILVMPNQSLADEAEVKITDYGATPVTTDSEGNIIGNNDDDSIAVNKAIHKSGASKIIIPPGIFHLDGSIKLKSGVTLEGYGSSSVLKQRTNIAVTTPSTTTVISAGLNNLRFEYNPPEKSDSDTALSLDAHQRSVFSDLEFIGYNDQTIVKLNPTVDTIENRNTTFNTYSRWYVSRVRIGVHYIGKQEAPITNNRWYDITFRQVTKNAILAESWADTERWYNLYAQAAAGVTSETILVNLNSQAEFTQIDRFQFYGAVLVAVDKPTTRATAVRFGQGTRQHMFYGMVTDGTWEDVNNEPTLFRDKGADSYYVILDHTGESTTPEKLRPAIFSKGFSTQQSGRVKFIAGSAPTITVYHNLRRKPSFEEIALTPGGNLKGRSFWVAGITDKKFDIRISEALDQGEVNIAWRVELTDY